MKRNSRRASDSCRPSSSRIATTSRLSARVRLDPPRRCMRRPRDCPSPCSISVRLGPGGGASSRIENYLGFPTGISGQALAARAFQQALKFGAHLAIPGKVTEVRRDDAACSP